MTRTNQQTSSPPPLSVPAIMSNDCSMPQHSMMSASRTRGEESETDVFMMDDVQFTASLDRLLDSELVNSAYNHNATTTTTTTTGQPQVVSTDPSVASTISSNRTRRQEQSHPQTTGDKSSLIHKQQQHQRLRRNHSNIPVFLVLYYHPRIQSQWILLPLPRDLPLPCHP